MKKKIFRKIILFVLCAFSLVTLILVLTTKNVIVSDPVFADHKDLYSAKNKHIVGTEYSTTSNEISISSITDNTSLTGKTITISTASELYQFSYKCYTDSNYLTYNYKVLCNIDYSSINDYFYPIGWQKDSSTSVFSGTFDGSGYDIKNLKMLVINSANSSNYTDQEYFAMFAKNSGTIKNFGLVDNSITITSLMTKLSNSGVANICGENSGEISNIYVKQLTKTINEGCGITALGGYRIAGIVAKNNSGATVKDGYIATNAIFDINCTDVIEFADVALSNEGTISNIYFLNKSINFTSTTFTDSGEYTIVFLDSTNIKTKSGSNYIGSLINSEDALNQKFESVSNWSIRTTNTGNISDYFTNNLPVCRTITYSGKTISIKDANDFVLMFNLLNANPYFATKDITYSIEADIDLTDIPANAITYTHAIDATITGENYGAQSSVVLSSGEKNNYPTIYNAHIVDRARTTTTLGIDSYGLFPYLTGTVKNLNVYYDSLDLSNIKESNNVKSIGLISGYTEKCTIDNVNVYVKSLTSNSTTILNEYYFGGIAGVASEACIKNVTSSGNVTFNANANYSSTNTLMQGIALGGIVGFLDDSRSDIYTSLSAMNINFNCGANAVYAIGGVIGAGYTNNIYELENIGTINIGASSNITYNKLYVSGVIGRLLGINKELYSLTNQGTVNVYANSNNSYVSGILNADIQTKTSASGSISASPYTRNDSVQLFDLSGAANRADVNVLSSGNNLYYTSGINVLSNNCFVSRIKYLYNLEYNELYVSSKGSDKYQTKLGNQNIDVSKANNYSGLINNINPNSNFNMTLENAYNLRNVDFVSTSSISSDLNYYGVANGSYITCKNISNEGNLTFTITDGANQNGISNYKMNVAGLISEISSGNTASNLFNGGNITFTENASTNLYLDLYIAGICLNNLNEDTSVTQNPLSQKFNKEEIGSLDNSINNGDIIVTSSNLNSALTATTGTDVSNVTYPSQTSNTYFLGSAYIAGITYLNKGVISNAFNLGDLTIRAFAKTKVTYLASGISCLLDGSYAIIKNSANNGTIKSISIANQTTNTNYYYTYASGIVGINNKHTTNVNEVISFAINYGTILAFSGLKNNTRSTISSPYSYSGGILAYGALNIVNVLNYGNIYGSEVIGSIIGAFDLNYENTSFYLANTINYGSVNVFEQYVVSGTDITNASENDIYTLNSSFLSKNYGTYTDTNPYYCGAMFGLVDFNSGNSSLLNIRYVINLCQNQNITQSDNQLNTTTIDTSTFITTRDANDKFGGVSIKYAPMSNVSDEAGNVGVFSKDFIFRKAINGDTSVIDYDTYQTDSYISDYFSFINYDKANTYLIEKIGWRTTAYLNAAEELAKNVGMMSKFVNYGSYIKSNITDINASYNSDTWTSNIDSTILENVITEIVKKGELDSSYSDIIKYFLFESTYTSSVYQSIRESIIDNILNYLEEDNVKYKELIQNLLYDEVLAKVVSGEDLNYTSVQESINSVLGKLTTTELREIITNYLTNISSNSSIIDPLFNDTTGSYYALNKYNLVNSLLEGYSGDTISEMYKAIYSASETNDSLKYYDYLKNHDSDAKEIFATIISANDLSSGTTINSNLVNILNKGLKKYDTSTYDVTQTKDYYTSLSASEYINGESVTITKNYTELWNIVKNISSFKNYIEKNSGLMSEHTDPTSSTSYISLIAKATEYNSTYQSEDGPSTKTNGKNSTTGIMQVTGETASVYNRFIYTPDSIVSTNTYYYGPFNAYGKLLNEAASFSDKSTYNSDIYNASKITSTTNFYTPFYMALNEDMRTEYINASNTTSTQKSVGTYYWNTGTGDANSNQWVSDYIIKNRPDNVSNFLQKNSDTGDYIIDGFDFKNYSSYNNGSSITKATKESEHNNIKDKYITGYGTSSVYTGIWYPVSIWYENKAVVGVYLCTQSGLNFEGSYKGAQTTEYTYYTIDDLVSLDGVRTKGKCTGTDDSDEINVISAIMTKILSTDNGKTAVLNALSEYAKTNDFGSSNYASLEYLATSLIGTTFASDIVSKTISLESQSTLKDLSYDATNTTLYSKLEALVQTVTYGDKENLAFYCASNKEAFIKLLNITLTDFSEYDNDNGTNEITTQDFTYYLYTYISYLKEQNSEITNEQIVNIINSVNESDLTNLDTLDELGYTNYIDYFDEAAYNNDTVGFGKSVNFNEVDTNIRNLAADTTYTNWFSGESNSGAYPKEGYVYPLNIKDITTLEAADNNIGYFTGSNNSLKTYKITNSFSSGYKLYSRTSNNTDNEITPKGDVKTTLDKDLLNSSQYYALAFSNTISTDDFKAPSANDIYGIKLVKDSNTVGTPKIAGEDASNWVLPGKSLYFMPKVNGILKMVIYTGNSRTTAPGLYTIERNAKTEYYDKTTTNIKVNQVTKAYVNGDNIIYGDSTTGTLAYDSSWYTSLTANILYFIEIPVIAGQEYALSRGGTSGSSSYVLYLDLGQNESNYTYKYPDLTQIESNFNTYYNSGTKLSDFANKILAKDFINVVHSGSNVGTNSTEVTTTNDSILLVKATSSGIPITVSGTVKYNDNDGNSVELTSTTFNSKTGYLAFYLNGGTTYKISADTDSISEIILVDKTKSYTINTTDGCSIKYGDNTILSGITSYTDLNSYKITSSQKLFETLELIYPTIKSDSKYDIFNNEVFTDEDVKNIIKKLSNSDYADSTNSVLAKLLGELDSKYYGNLIINASDEAKTNILKKMVELNGSGTYENTDDLLIAAFIGDDYLTNSNKNSLTSSILYNLLNTYESGEYQFITSDTTIDFDKFDEFVVHLGGSSSMDVYGIFALSSSLGEKNGTFIPDNIDLKGNDFNYNVTDDIYVLSDDTNSYWRDLTGASTDSYFDISNENSVNYAIRYQMKQLKLSISTQVFESDITFGDYTIYASESTIDVSNGTITYYIPQSYIDELRKHSDASIVLDKAESATTTVTSLDFTKIVSENGYYILSNAFRVTAEDSTVYTDYSIILKPIAVSITSFTSDKNTIVYSGDTVTLTVKSNLPDNYDLGSRLTINDIYASSSEVKWHLDTSVKNNGIVSNGSCSIVIVIDEAHVGGNLSCKLNLYTDALQNSSLTITKEKNTSASITSFEFEGEELKDKFTTNTLTSYINFGRAYNSDNFSDYTSSNFYLSNFEISSNASVTISVIKNLSDNNIMTYIVTYVVTAEDNNSQTTYTHYLIEKNPYENNSQYANIYKDGEIVINDDIYKSEFSYNGTTLNNSSEASLNYTSGIYSAVMFNRGLEPEYRIKYFLNNFYTLGVDVNYSLSEETLNNGTSTINTVAGFIASISDSIEPNVFKYEYVYTNSGTWDGESYERTYTFPALYIIKGYSRDALLNRLTFLNSAISIGNTATAIKANNYNNTNAIVLSKENTSCLANGDVLYTDMFNNTNNAISVDGLSINYTNGADDYQYTDYFAIGTVNEVDLSYYAPTFGIESHAQIYQYTTKKKLTAYGLTNKQSYTDSAILSNHDDIYLYVPFTYITSSGEKKSKVFLVSLDSNYNWTKVYDTTDVDTVIYTYTTTFDTLSATSSDVANFSYNGVSYTLSSSCGEANDNDSLYMDYIGDPLDNHFYYVSYLVFSESSLHGDFTEGNIRYIHISIVDSTNTIKFDVTLYATGDLTLDEVYMTISENIYTNQTLNVTRQISGYLVKGETEEKKNKVIDNVTYYVYTLRYNLQMLPKGYFSFYLDLPSGFVPTVTTDMANQLDTSTAPGKDEEGTFLPFTSIIPKTITLDYYVSVGNYGKDIWAVKTSNLYTRKATYYYNAE